MYDKINRTKEQRTTGFKITVVVVLAVLILCGSLLAWGVSYRNRYWDFVSHISDSTVYAYSHHSMHARVNGDGVWVRGENVQSLYNHITVCGMGRTGAAPKGEPEIFIEYGDGGILKVYPAEREGFSAYLLYENGDYSYGYSTSGITVETIVVNYLSLENNVIWSKPIGE